MPALSLVSDKTKPTPLSVVEIKASLQRCEREIGLLTRERNRLHAERHAALVGDLAEARELHDQVCKLDENLSVLQEKHRSLETELQTAERREAAAALRVRQHKCQQIAKTLRQKVVAVQAQVDELARMCQEDIRSLDEQYCRELPELPGGQAMIAFSNNLPGLIARRFEALIKGNQGCKGTLETGYQLLQSGKVDLLRSLETYIHVGESAFYPEPPSAA